jgi:biotin carboxyl carrier protein
MKYTVTVESDCFDIEVGRDGRVWVNRRPYDVDLQSVDGTSQYSLLLDHRSYEAHIERIENGECHVMVGGRPYRAYLDGDGRRRNGNGSNGSPGCKAVARAEVRAPLPGLLVELHVQEGDRVSEKDIVAVLESMKMNLELRAPRAGVVCGLQATSGNEVGQDEVLVVIKLEDV